MAKNLDTRDYNFIRPTSSFAATAAASVSAALPGNHQVRVERLNSFTGSPTQLRSVNAGSAFGFVPGVGATDQSLIASAIDHLRTTASALGFSQSEVPEFVPDAHVKETSAGDRVVNLRQQ